MSYADQLPIIAAQYRAEMRKCEEERRAMWHEFVKRIREQREEQKP